MRFGTEPQAERSDMIWQKSSAKFDSHSRIWCQSSGLVTVPGFGIVVNVLAELLSTFRGFPVLTLEKEVKVKKE